MTKDAIFYIKYYATKYGETIERKGQLDGVAKGEYITKKGHLITCHQKWIESVLNQMKEIKLGLKGYKYLDEAIELCTELGLSVNDAEIIRTNSTGLVIYNPKNLADRIKGMKNKNISREQKIALRKAYNKQQSTQ